MKKVYGVRKNTYENCIIIVLDEYEDAKCLAATLGKEEDAEELVVPLLYVGSDAQKVNQGYQTVYRAEEWMED